MAKPKYKRSVETERASMILVMKRYHFDLYKQ